MLMSASAQPRPDAQRTRAASKGDVDLTPRYSSYRRDHTGPMANRQPRTGDTGATDGAGVCRAMRRQPGASRSLRANTHSPTSPETRRPSPTRTCRWSDNGGPAWRQRQDASDFPTPEYFSFAMYAFALSAPLPCAGRHGGARADGTAVRRARVRVPGSHRSRLHVTTRAPAARTRPRASAASPAGGARRPLQVIISGAPASGKGTQCARIVEEFDLVHISTGDMLRAAVKAESQLGKEAKQYMDSGKLVPDDLVIAMLQERISADDCKRQGWLLDGFPRTAAQANALDDANVDPDAVLLLEVDDEVLVERVVGRRLDPVTGAIYHVKFSPPPSGEVEARLTQRSDDTEEKARTRLSQYYTHAASIQDHYASKITRINGDRSKDDVFADVSIALKAAVGPGDNQDSSPPSGGANAVSGEATKAATADASATEAAVSEFVRRAEEAFEKGYMETDKVTWSGQAGIGRNLEGVSSYPDIRGRLDLAFGDTVAFLLFAYIGRATHGNPTLDLGVLETAAPFLAGWFLLSPLVGAYTRKAVSSRTESLKYAALAWAPSVALGLAIRCKYLYFSHCDRGREGLFRWERRTIGRCANL